MNKKALRILLPCAILLSCTSQAADEKLTTSNFEDFQQIKALTLDHYCSKDKHSKIQKELIEISENDRADRVTPNAEMTANDIVRRVRVAAIAAEACLKDKDDYFTAAVVFQHGSLPEHYLQAITYAGKSVELGHPVGGALREAAIDRYLMSLGHKQIFGSQVAAPAIYKAVESEKDMVACLWPVENSIDLVEDYSFGSEKHRLKLRETIAFKKQQFPECDFPARDSSTMLSALISTKI